MGWYVDRPEFSQYSETELQCGIFRTYKIMKIMSLVQPNVLFDEGVEAQGRLRACSKVLGVYLLQNPDQNVVAKIKKRHGSQ